MSDNNSQNTQSQNMNDKQAMQALKQHGGNIVFAIAVVLAGYFGWSYFQQNNVATVDPAIADKYLQISQLNESITNQSNQADISADDKQVLSKQQQQLTASIDSLVAENADNIYAWQSLMIKAKQYMDANDAKSAIPVLKSALAMKIDDAGLQAIARIRYAQALLADGQLDEAKKVVVHEVPGSFEATKQELLGDIYLAKNDKESAIRSYDNAWKLLVERQENRGLLMLKMEGLGMQVTPIETKALFEKSSKPQAPAQASAENIVN